jgi:hypothetical protein
MNFSLFTTTNVFAAFLPQNEKLKFQEQFLAFEFTKYCLHIKNR